MNVWGEIHSTQMINGECEEPFYFYPIGASIPLETYPLSSSHFEHRDTRVVFVPPTITIPARPPTISLGVPDTRNSTDHTEATLSLYFDYFTPGTYSITFQNIIDASDVWTTSVTNDGQSTVTTKAVVYNMDGNEVDLKWGENYTVDEVLDKDGIQLEVVVKGKVEIKKEPT
ncbi:hypothetical protein BLNAU_11361 [Blattamonas nauphoetae]|uniref:Uncharacterized protein n=1 Tax=Blattamonas nauphoetae TaxID=2049346 RepID=A0ABQ9XQW8_9EUKA|nr:hypothetical protein BLNAU_11361 [Blattamonas nauphoetae]